jgi:hypothetical protein
MTRTRLALAAAGLAAGFASGFGLSGCFLDGGNNCHCPPTPDLPSGRYSITGSTVYFPDGGAGPAPIQVKGGTAIFSPKQIRIMYSQDGVDFTVVYKVAKPF